MSGSACVFTGLIDIATCTGNGFETNFPNCKTLSYDRILNKYTCTHCNTDYYLTGQNLCALTNCATKVPGTEECVLCKTKWEIPEDGLYCTECNCLKGNLESGTDCVKSKVTVSTCTGLSSLFSNCVVADFTVTTPVCFKCVLGYREGDDGQCKNNHCAVP